MLLAPVVLLAPQQLTPPPIDFGLTPYGNYCEDSSPCYPHPPYGAWIGNAECLPEVTTDFAGVARPNRAPNILNPPTMLRELQ